MGRVGWVLPVSYRTSVCCDVPARSASSAWLSPACQRAVRSRMPALRVAVVLGVLAHAAVLRSFGLPQSRWRFGHGVVHALPNGLLLADSYHVSRYNTNTGRLTEPMFEAVIAQAKARLG